MSAAREVVERHLHAFNAHATSALLADFAPDAVWVTGRDTVRGSTELAELFDDGLWELRPSLAVRSMIVGDDAVAAELIETITVDGTPTTFAIAVFFTVVRGRITSAKVYREGSADL